MYRQSRAERAARWYVVSFAVIASTACSADGWEEVGEYQEPLVQCGYAHFRAGASPTTGYVSYDATISEAAPAGNYGENTTCIVDGYNSGPADRSCLMRWPVAGHIPAGSTVISARIGLNITNGSNQTHQIYQIKPVWFENIVTWGRPSTVDAWDSAGADGPEDRGAELGTITGAEGATTVFLNASGKAVVQDWVDGEPNGGIIFANSSNSDGMIFASSESSAIDTRPELAISYVPPGSTSCSGGAGGGPGGGFAGGGSTASNAF